MHCANCNNTVSASATFCTHCGKPMASSGVNPSGAHNPSTHAYSAPPPHHAPQQNVEAASQGHSFGQDPAQQLVYPAPPPAGSAYSQDHTFGQPSAQPPGYASPQPQPMYNTPQGQPYAYPQQTGHYPRTSSTPNKKTLLAIGGGVAALLVIVGIIFFMGGRTVLQGTWVAVHDSNSTIEFSGSRFTVSSFEPMLGATIQISGTFAIHSDNLVDLSVTNVQGTGMEARELAEIRQDIMGEIISLEFEIVGNTLRTRELGWGGWEEFRRR